MTHTGSNLRKSEAAWLRFQERAASRLYGNRTAAGMAPPGAGRIPPPSQEEEQ
jgi:hypothetical protein